MKKSIVFVLGLIVSAWITACTSSNIPMATNLESAGEYQLSPGDRLQVRVFGEDALSKNYVVTSEGDISFPLLGTISVKGYTTEDLAAHLQERLSVGFLNDPVVNIEIVSFRPIYILGEVQRSGDYNYKPNLTALQAVALAGGFSYRANQTKIFIRRADDDQELAYRLDDGKPIYIKPGDTIRVGERFF